MRSAFPLFQSHLDLAHAYWQRLLRPGDCVIDATCGNGRDTLELAQLVLTQESGAVYAIDIQEEAIRITQNRLQAALDPQRLARMHLRQQSHGQFPAELSAETVRLIVYNLGYLPGGDKRVTTHVETTLSSLKEALPLLMPGGCISLTAYPGHTEGERERSALLKWTSGLDPTLWSCCEQVWLNREAAPTLFFIQRVQPTT